MGLYQERVIDPKIIAVYNATGSTILKGTIVKHVTPTAIPQQVTPATAATDSFFGVAMADILNLQYGDCQYGGVAIVLAGATIAAGVNITSGGTGKAALAASGNAIVGISLTDGVLDGYMEVMLATPGGEANN